MNQLFSIRSTLPGTLAALGVLCLAACNSSNNNGAIDAVSPGHQTVQGGGTDMTTQCDDLRRQGRRDSFQALGIDMLEKGSDQILSKMTDDDYKKIEEDAPIATVQAQQEIDKIISDATQAADLNWATLQLGPETHRKLLLGNPDYLDRQGRFSVGSTTVDDESMLKMGDAGSVFLVLEPETFLTYHIEIEIVSSIQKDTTAHVETQSVSALDYVNSNLLPAACAGVPSNIDSSTFNTVPVSPLP